MPLALKRKIKKEQEQEYAPPPVEEVAEPIEEDEEVTEDEEEEEIDYNPLTISLPSDLKAPPTKPKGRPPRVRDAPAQTVNEFLVFLLCPYINS